MSDTRYVKFDTSVSCMVDDDEDVEAVGKWLGMVQTLVVKTLADRSPHASLDGPYVTEPLKLYVAPARSRTSKTSTTKTSTETSTKATTTPRTKTTTRRKSHG